MGDRHEPLVEAGYRFARALARDADSARDLVHDAWLSLLARHGTMPDRALLFRAIRHRYIDEYRRGRRAATVDFDDTDPAAHAAGGGAGGLADPADPRLAAALGTLRDVEREALFLAVVEGYTATEIARLTGSPRGTVLSLVHRARGKLRTALVAADEVSGRAVERTADRAADRPVVVRLTSAPRSAPKDASPTMASETRREKPR